MAGKFDGILPQRNVRNLMAKWRRHFNCRKLEWNVAGANSTTFYLATNPYGFTTTTIQAVLNSLSASGCLSLFNFYRPIREHLYYIVNGRDPLLSAQFQPRWICHLNGLWWGGYINPFRIAIPTTHNVIQQAFKLQHLAKHLDGLYHRIGNFHRNSSDRRSHLFRVPYRSDFLDRACE